MDNIENQINSLNMIDLLRLQTFIDEKIQTIKEKNPQKIYTAKYYIKNKDKLNQKVKEWRENKKVEKKTIETYLEKT